MRYFPCRADRVSMTFPAIARKGKRDWLPIVQYACNACRALNSKGNLVHFEVAFLDILAPEFRKRGVE